jgi:hypothetical protein
MTMRAWGLDALRLQRDLETANRFETSARNWFK